MKNYQLSLLLANLFLMASYFKEGSAELTLFLIGVLWFLVGMINLFMQQKIDEIDNRIHLKEITLILKGFDEIIKLLEKKNGKKNKR